MNGDTITIMPGPASPFFLNTNYAEVYIADGAYLMNVSLLNDATNFVFLGGGGGLNTLGYPYFQGVVSNFQAGDQLILQDIGQNNGSPNNPWNSFIYDQAAQSLDFLLDGKVVASLTITQHVVNQYSTSSFTVSAVVPASGVSGIASGMANISVSTPAIAPSVAVATTRSQATVIAGPGEEHVIAPRIDMQALPGQSLAFDDGTLSFDLAAFLPPDTQLPRIYRLYQTALGRAPDQRGEKFWNNAFNHGVTDAQLAAFFLASDEFQGRFGNLGNTIL
jgi:hypothetical protein